MANGSRLAALGGLILVLGVAGWWVFGRGGPPPLADDAARQIAESFLADVRAGRADAAWAGTSAEFKSLMGRDAFRAFVKSMKALKAPAEFERGERVERDGLHLAECHFRPQGGGAIRVILAPEAGAWKVERLIAD